jgi:CHASE2 domain-containing sensor protein
MTWGDINIWLWIIMFVATLLYEGLTILTTISIVRLRSWAVANYSLLINVIGMGSVVVYTGELNTMIPILAGVYIANYATVEYERKKKEREPDKKKIL